MLTELFITALFMLVTVAGILAILVSVHVALVLIQYGRYLWRRHGQ